MRGGPWGYGGHICSIIQSPTQSRLPSVWVDLHRVTRSGGCACRSLAVTVRLIASHHGPLGGSPHVSAAGRPARFPGVETPWPPLPPLPPPLRSSPSWFPSPLRISTSLQDAMAYVGNRPLTPVPCVNWRGPLQPPVNMRRPPLTHVSLQNVGTRLLHGLGFASLVPDLRQQVKALRASSENHSH